ncbi:MAG: cation diffusion facilitator family transporter [Deltaproteobacteria bacterium]|jgi:cation diffusion facilitator family transporter|nr:cation diffusion facilitator family transporter [Deltaproteobacteria bacterium]
MNQESDPRQPKIKTRTAALSIASNSVLIAVKLAAGISTGSVAIISEAVHSFLDLMAALMAWMAVRVSDNPPDYDHPFGHGKTENLAALFEALLIVFGGAFIVKESIEGLIRGRELPDLKIGLAVMFLATIVNIVISKRLFKIGRATQSPALEADAWHLMTDVYTSGGIFAALLIIEIGRWVAPSLDLTKVDGLSALIVSFMIIKTGCSLGWEAVCNLVDRRLSPQEIALIEEHIHEVSGGLYGYRRLRTRRSGPFRIVLVDLLVDGRLSVSEAHELSVKVVKGIRDHYPAVDVTCHFEPVDVDSLTERFGKFRPSDGLAEIFIQETPRNAENKPENEPVVSDAKVGEPGTPLNLPQSADAESSGSAPAAESSGLAAESVGVEPTAESANVEPAAESAGVRPTAEPADDETR